MSGSCVLTNEVASHLGVAKDERVQSGEAGQDEPDESKAER